MFKTTDDNPKITVGNLNNKITIITESNNIHGYIKLSMNIASAEKLIKNLKAQVKFVKKEIK